MRRANTLFPAANTPPVKLIDTLRIACESGISAYDPPLDCLGPLLPPQNRHRGHQSPQSLSCGHPLVGRSPCRIPMTPQQRQEANQKRLSPASRSESRHREGLPAGQGTPPSAAGCRDSMRIPGIRGCRTPACPRAPTATGAGMIPRDHRADFAPLPVIGVCRDRPHSLVNRPCGLVISMP